MTDNQWPSTFDLGPGVSPFDSILGSPEICSQIERRFEESFGINVVLMLSCRAAISAILEYESINRSHIAFAPKWSSYCVWDAIGRRANPTACWCPEIDVILAVHKWGRVNKFRNPGTRLVIEDSVDTVFENGKTLFPNGGKYEILSLPKISAAPWGGLILTRDDGAANDLRAKRTQACTRPEIQGESMKSIQNCFDNFEQNRSIIRSRLKRLEETVIKSYLQLSENRLPPVIPLPLEKFATLAEKHDLLVRHYSFTGWLDEPSYELTVLLPIHFRIPDKEFERILESVAHMRPGY